MPEEHRTPELCLAAVKHDGYNLIEVPKEHITPEIFEFAEEWKRALKDYKELLNDQEKATVHQIMTKALAKAISENTVSYCDTLYGMIKGGGRQGSLYARAKASAETDPIETL